MSTTSAPSSDSRFDRLATDPRFKSVPRRARKVRIDGRFQSMFTSDRFKVAYSVDKRGRHVNMTSSEDLRKYYDLDEEEEDPKGKQKRSSVAAASNVSSKQGTPSTTDEQVENRAPTSDESEGEAPALAAIGDTDLATPGPSREELKKESDASDDEDGEEGRADDDDGSSSTSNDTDIETLGADQLDEVIVHSWGDLESNVLRSEAVGRRLALCNMDWDRVSAQDLFVLFNSFKPQGGSVISVTIYPSDYGLERMEKEEQSGPLELTQQASDEDEEEEFSKEKLRQYQMNRLKYYYAVMECDSKSTAEHIYTNCDGMEYEHSANRFDLRYIPDDMSFDDRQPKSRATESTIPTDFTPSDFFSSALQQSKVQLTWDETDPQRVKTTMKKFTEEEALQQDFDAYLASSSDEEGGEGEGASVTEDEQIKKYRALLDGAKEKCGDDSDMDMEITWEPGLKESADSLVEKKLVEKEVGKLTSWQQHVQDKKKRVKELREKRKEEKATLGGLPEAAHGAGENGFNDPFFQQDNDPVPAKTQISKKLKKSRDNQLDKQQKSELELLVQDEEPGKHHFSLKGILQQEKGGKRKKKRGNEEVEPDTFQMDVSDPRFSALYDSHLYAVDPSDSHYKPTKGMGAIMEERLKRRRQDKTVNWKEATGHQGNKSTPGAKLNDSSIGSLVKSVKSKTLTLQKFREERKAKRAKI